MLYHVQGEGSILTWRDSQQDCEVAVSFAEPQSCAHVHECIKKFQQDMALEAQAGVAAAAAASNGGGGGTPGGGLLLGGSAPVGPMHVDERAFFQAQPEHLREAGMFGGTGPASVARTPGLPEPKAGQLAEMLRVLEDSPHFHRECLLGQILAEGWLRQLLSLLPPAEDLEDLTTLHDLHRVVRALVLLGDSNLLEVLFGEELCLDVIGALEYDPESPGERLHHRSYLREKLLFKEVVALPSPAVREKIHQTQRLGYVKDTVLAKHLDDHSFGTISSIMLFNNVEVLSALIQDKDFYPALFSRFKTVAQDSEEWRDLVAFLQELCSMSKQLQNRERQEMVQLLTQHGLFDVIKGVLESGDREVNLNGLDVLVSLLQHDASPLRDHFTQEENPGLFAHMVRGLLDRRSGGAQEMMLEIMRLLLDPESMDNSVEKDKFLDLFYRKDFLALVIDPLKDAALDPNTAVLIVDLLIFCMHNHGFLIKYYILRTNALHKVLGLLRRRERWAACAAVRFLRQCMGTKDDFYLRHITKNSAILPVLEAYERNAGRRNLLDSAVLEMIDFIAHQKPSGILEHLVEKHAEKLRGLGGAFKDLVELQEEILRGRLVERGGAGDGGVDDAEEARARAMAPALAGVGEGRLPLSHREGLAAAAAAAAREEAQRLRIRRRPDGSMSLEEESYFSEDDDALGESSPSRPAASPGEGSGGAALPPPQQPEARVITTDDLAAFPGSKLCQFFSEYDSDEEVGPPPPARARVGDEDGEEGDLLLAAKKRQRPSPSPEPSGSAGQGGGGGVSDGGAGGSGFWKTPG